MPASPDLPRASASAAFKPWIVLQALTHLSLIVLVWLLAIAPVGLVVLGVVAVRLASAAWRALSSRAGR